MVTLKKAIVSAMLAALATTQAAAAATERPVVLELFTSQGCSSCPPADALLRQLAVESPVLALSFHVHYWDYLGWKDTFSSPENTERQHQYALNLGQQGMFTPQLIVDGTRSAVGSNQGDVAGAIRAAQQDMVSVPMTLKADTAGKVLKIHIATLETSPPPASVYAMRFQRNATTEVKAGENSGRTLSSINSVVEIKKLGEWKNQAADYQVALNHNDNEGIAILLQSNGQGRILSAQTYNEK